MSLEIPYRSRVYEEYSLYFSLFHEHLDGILIIKGNKVIECNYSAIKIFKYKSKEELMGKSPYKLSPLIQEDGKTYINFRNK